MRQKYTTNEQSHFILLEQNKNKYQHTFLKQLSKTPSN